RTLVLAGAANEPTLPPTIAALSSHERRNYSLATLIQNCLNGKLSNTLESEISDGLTKDGGSQRGGLLIPTPFWASGLDTKTDGAGGFSTTDKILDIEMLLRNKSVCLNLGASLLDGLKFGAAIPLENSGTSATWVSENPGSDVAQTDPS